MALKHISARLQRVLEAMPERAVEPCKVCAARKDRLNRMASEQQGATLAELFAKMEIATQWSNPRQAAGARWRLVFDPYPMPDFRRPPDASPDGPGSALAASGAPPDGERT